MRWLCDREGRCHAKEYYDSTPGCRAGLAAQAKQVAIQGHVTKVPENGHQLEGEYSDLYELKPGDHRFFGFRNGSDFYLTNGAMKKPKKKQVPDYRLALRLRAEFLADAASTAKKVSK